ncbi:MAG: thioesterase [Comamonadaceae bacterium]|nr:MAG: thioesterase [Comamonadaceae bacterium]
MKNGSRTLIEQVVETRHLASEFAETAGESYPAVLATPAMVALLERACAKLLAPLLKPDQLSVGAVVNISHTAPTALGEVVVAEATFEGKDGHLYWFEVALRDAHGPIGQGRHARAIVSDTMIKIKSEARRAAVLS